MRFFGQGATQSSSLRYSSDLAVLRQVLHLRRSASRTYCPLVGQGATEYLVLLAVVLIVALVSVALLGFFPGMASDAQVTQSKTYWSSASPIAVIDAGARYFNQSAAGSMTIPYFRVRNVGSYPITLTKMLAGNTSVSTIWTGNWGPVVAMNTRYTLAPGEESDFLEPAIYGGTDLGIGNRHFVTFVNPDGNTSGSAAWSSNFQPPGAAKSYCDRAAPYGYFIIENFGFEYTLSIEGQTITKRQIGTKPIIAKCKDNYN